MLNYIIRFSIRNRLAVIGTAAVVAICGCFVLLDMPVSVLPEVDRFSVTVISEAPGLSPEEVEFEVVRPLESVLNGIPGSVAVRSTASGGLAIAQVQFDWQTESFRSRQLVQERLNQVQARLPSGVMTSIVPSSSLTGEIMLLGMTGSLQNSDDARSSAEWIVKPRLLAISGIARVTVLGGSLQQYQVLADPERMLRLGISFQKLSSSLAEATGAVDSRRNPGVVVTLDRELPPRASLRTLTLEEISQCLIETRDGLPIRIKDVAVVQMGAAPARGRGSVSGKPAVILAIHKHPGADTRQLTQEIDTVLAQLKSALPAGSKIQSDLFRQTHFINAAISNVTEAIRDGAILIVVVLFLFLLNVRATLVTLAAVPLTLICSALVFRFMGLSVNTMTLGGIALAMGELVDDAIVDVENIHRRLREDSIRHSLDVVFGASSEVRNVIVLSTAVVVLVCLPLFALSGIEGMLFRPLLSAYIMSILISLLVSLTVTPALSACLLHTGNSSRGTRDSFALSSFKTIAGYLYELSLPRPRAILAAVALLLLGSVWFATQMGREFLPPFNEGTATITLHPGPGTSLPEADRIGTLAEQILLEIPEVRHTGRRTGRAEQDEHEQSGNSSEIDVTFWSPGDLTTRPAPDTPPDSLRPREIVFQEMRSKLEILPGIRVNIGQPISHRIDHLLAGARAQVVVNILGPEQSTLRRLASNAEQLIEDIPGVVDLQAGQSAQVPYLSFRVREPEAARYGFSRAELIDVFKTIVSGKIFGSVITSGQSYDIALWVPESARESRDAVAMLPLLTPTGALIRISDVAECIEENGYNQIEHENGMRRLAVQCNIQGRDLGSAADEIKAIILKDLKLPQGYFVMFAGQNQEKQRAERLMGLLGIFTLLGIFVVVYAQFQSLRITSQIMINIPLAFIGGILALAIAREPLSLASMIGFISLAGIATRNGILMISHYLRLMREGLPFGKDLVVRGSRERVAPVVMTAATTILALVPLVLARGEPGKEILYPVALVLIGGMITSTLLDFIVTPSLFYSYGAGSAQSPLLAETDELLINQRTVSAESLK